MFTPSPLRLIADILAKTKTGRLHREQQKQVQELTHYVRSQLPAEHQPHLVRAYVEGGGLHLVADNAAWTTRLRYAATSILSQLRIQYPKEYAGLTQIKMQVAKPKR